MKNKFLQFLSLAFLFLFADFVASAQTTVPALITSNQVWDISGSPYTLNQNSLINTGVSVIVMPGVEIKSSNVYKLTVDGEFQCKGKWDSIIKISKIEIEFSSKSMGYNYGTGRGGYFNYCYFTGNGSGSNSIISNARSLKVNNCVFTNSYYCINVKATSSDTPTLTVTNSKFSGDAYGYGTAISVYGSKSNLIATNNYFTRTMSVYATGSVFFKNNTLYKVQAMYLYLHRNSEISCNRFINMFDGIDINTGGYLLKNEKLIFSNNTLDTMGSSTSGAMLRLSKNSSSITNYGKVEFKDNNFLNVNNGLPKVRIIAYNATPTKTDSVDFSSNYWGTNDSATIENFIKDYSDDVQLYGKVIFKSFKSGPIIGCSYNNSCARANFKYTMKDSIVTFKDSSFGSKPYKVKWKFGDGNRNDSNKKTIIHHYNTPGTYLACLYVYDTSDNFCDSMCSVIIIKNKTKCNASYYIAVDTTKPNYFYIVNTSKGTTSQTKYYWTFGDGTGSSSTNPSHTYGTSGRYQLCLTIFDTTAACYSTFCDSIDINSNGKVLLVLNEKDVTGIMETKVFNALSAYPNPSNGVITINLSTNQINMVRIDIMNAQGQILKTEYQQTEVGYNDIPLNLSNYEDGLYFLLVRTPDFSKNLKIVLRK